MAITNIRDNGGGNAMTRKEAKPKAKDSLTALIQRTDKENPNPEDLKKIRAILDEDDTLMRINESSEQAFNRVIGTFTKSALSEELFRRQIKAKREKLDYDSANVMVQMLINQVILCHIRMTSYEGFHAEKIRESLSIESG